MTTQELLMKTDGARPLYYRLKELLKGELARNFEPNQRFYSVRDLVGRHGVSTITVTRTLRELVNEGYLYARQGKGTFVSPRPSARPARAARRLIISIPSLRTMEESLLDSDRVRTDYSRGLADAALEHNAIVEYQLVPLAQTFDFIMELIERPTPHGVILYGTSNPVYSRLLDRAIERGIPYVAFQPERGLTWEQIHRRNCHYVTTDQQEGIRQATAHLIELGHRRIAYWQHERTAYTRLEGFRRAMQAAKLQVDAEFVEHRFDFDAPCADSLRRLIHRGVTALVTASDYIAIQALREAAEAGIDIPRQLSVTGFDDNPEAATLSPPLTTVSVRRYETGREVAMTMIRQFQDPQPQRRYQIMTPTKLVVRGSTGLVEQQNIILSDEITPITRRER